MPFQGNWDGDWSGDWAGAGGGAPVDVKISWLELDTAATPVDVKISWLELDTAATPVDVKISWLELDTAAPVEAGGRRASNWLKQIRDASVALPHTRARTGVRPVSVVAVDPEAVVGQFTGYMAAPVAPVPMPTTADAHAHVVLPSTAASTAARGLRVRSAACAQLPSTATRTEARAVAAHASAAVVLTHTRTTPVARDFDEVYAQRDISDEELLLLTSELVYN